MCQGPCARYGSHIFLVPAIQDIFQHVMNLERSHEKITRDVKIEPFLF